MDWSFRDLFDAAGEHLSGFYTAFSAEGQEQGIAAMLAPVAPYNNSSLLTPLVTVVSVISLLVLSGVALGAFAALLTSLLALYFLLTEVFGYELQLGSLQSSV